MDLKNLFNRADLKFYPLNIRVNRVEIETEKIDSRSEVPKLSDKALESIERAARAIREARTLNRPVILAFGAHAIKNGLGPLLAEFAEKGWFTHLATNGAGVIHDWEFSYIGMSSENVKENAGKGMFGMWDETGKFINLAIVAGAYRGLGYGEAVGSMIADNGIVIPDEDELLKMVTSDDMEKAASAADFIDTIRKSGLKSGHIEINHPYKKYSLQYRTFIAGVPFTAHPMFGHDIIYTHPMNKGAAIGRTAERDFLRFAESVSRIENGVYLSVGSAVMSPMIFEKSFSMAQNVSIQNGSHIIGHKIFVVDLSESSWDWREGEPSEDNPAYYMRHLKSFSRMGGVMEYISADNRAFFLNLWRLLEDGNRPGCHFE
ncbi:MAG TPA: hypothetical protein VIS94_01120 [Desulfomonilia bacterium]